MCECGCQLTFFIRVPELSKALSSAKVAILELIRINLVDTIMCDLAFPLSTTLIRNCGSNL